MAKKIKPDIGSLSDKHRYQQLHRPMPLQPFGLASLQTEYATIVDADSFSNKEGHHVRDIIKRKLKASKSEDVLLFSLSHNERLLDVPVVIEGYTVSPGPAERVVGAVLRTKQNSPIDIEGILERLRIRLESLQTDLYIEPKRFEDNIRTVVTKRISTQHIRNAYFRNTLVDRYGIYSSSELADLRGSKAANKSALASRWVKSGRTFPVHWGDDSNSFLAFQFFDYDGFEPHPAVAPVLEILSDRQGWELAHWFCSPNEFLEGEIPAKLLAKYRDVDLTEAAQDAIDSLVL
jgi:hypothetical protein